MKTITLKKLSTLLILLLIVCSISQAQNCPHEVKIALVADYSMYQKHGANTEQYIKAALADAATKFDDEFNEPISFKVVDVYIANTAGRDIWSNTTNATTLMSDFIANEADRNAVDYDIASFWTTRDIYILENGMQIDKAGLARYTVGLCLEGYNIIKDTDKSTSTLTHEIGHLFGADHDPEGSNTIMATPSNFTNWSPQSINQINDKLKCVCPFVDLSAGICPGVGFNNSYSATFYVNNLGNLPSAQTKAGFYISNDGNITISDKLLESKTLNAIGAGEETSLQFSANLNNIDLPGGDYFLGVILDYENNITESREDNNTGCKTAVTLPGKPDLDITYCANIRINRNTISSPNISVKNSSDKAASTSELGIYLSNDRTINKDVDYLVGKTSIGTLSANASATFEVSTNVSELSSPIPAGTYFVGLVADYKNNLSESNETNNTCYNTSVRFRVTYGCKDNNAQNYMPDATFKDNTLCEYAAACESRDKAALTALYNSTDGANWTNKWNLSEPINNWFGVTVNSNGCVTSLKLEKNNLAGTIPTQLADLTELTTLVMYSNKLTGEIPAGLGNLMKLKTFHFSHNNLSGEIPDDLGFLNNLAIINLSNNNLSGCYNLNLLNLCGVSTILISGGNPSLADWDTFCNTNNNEGVCGAEPPAAVCAGQKAALTALYNSAGGANWTNEWNLNDPISTWFGVTVNSNGCVTSLKLEKNNLTGTIPTQLADLTELTTLVMYTNKLAGEIPAELGNLTKLKTFHFSHNDLTGEIPNTLGNLNNLAIFNLSNNDLTGSIPFHFGDLRNLKTLNLTNNKLSGCYDAYLINLCGVPANILISGGNPSLSDWDTFCNTDNNEGVCGAEPPAAVCAGQKAALTALYNSAGGANWTNEWNLNDPISTWFGVTVNSNGCVTSLKLEKNNLVGTIPTQLADLTELTTLVMYTNKLRGTIPAELGNLTKLKTFHFSHNDLSGEIPNTIGNLNNVALLNLSNNDLTGSIPFLFGELRNLKTLNLTNNKLSGCYDAYLINLCGVPANILISGGNPSLSDWDTFCNTNNNEGVCGAEPPAAVCAGQKAALTALYNSAGGTNWTNNWNLNNPISTWHGVVVNSNGCVTSLKLEKNNLTGTIPTQLANLTELTTLVMYSNKLTGQIPAALGNLTKLKTFHFSHNNLSGEIPVELGKLENMVLFNLSNNQLSGFIPFQLAGINTNRMLKTLKLINNNFIGCFHQPFREAFCDVNTVEMNEGNSIDPPWVEFCAGAYGNCGDRIKKAELIDSYNYPNPFKLKSTIHFNLLNESMVSLKVYNAMGKEVAQLLNNLKLQKGNNSVVFDGTQYAPGIYYYSIQNNDNFNMYKMTLIK